MLKKTQRTKIALSLLMMSISVVVIIFILSGLSLNYNNKAVAMIGDQRIYESDVKEELLEIFPKSNPETFEVERLPDDVLNLIASSIYVKRVLDKQARRALVDKDAEIVKNIDRYSKKLIRERFIDLELDKRVNKQAIANKYTELSDKIKEDQKFAIAHILLASKEQAEKMIQKINSGEEEFPLLAIEYSLDKESVNHGGNLGYFSAKDMRKEFLEAVITMKKGDISEPIKTSDGWHIIKLVDVKVSNLKDFPAVENNIEEGLRKSELEKIYSEILENKEVILFN